MQHSRDGDGYWLGPTLFDHVTPDMSIYTDEIFGPVLSVIRVESYGEALALINPIPTATVRRYSQMTAEPPDASRTRFRSAWSASMCRSPSRWPYYSFGGWKNSLFGDTHAHGTEGVQFFTRGKVVTTRWPDPATGG